MQTNGGAIQAYSGNSDIKHWYLDTNGKYLRKVNFTLNFRIEWQIQVKMLIMSSLYKFEI